MQLTGGDGRYLLCKPIMFTISLQRTPHFQCEGSRNDKAVDCFVHCCGKYGLWRLSTRKSRGRPSGSTARRGRAPSSSVGHGRGGLAARVHFQSSSAAPAYRLGLLTIGTLHLGTPLGRIRHWLTRNGYDDTEAALPGSVGALTSPATGGHCATTPCATCRATGSTAAMALRRFTRSSWSIYWGFPEQS